MAKAKKTKTKAKAKAKAKPKLKAKPKSKAKPRSKAKPKTKARTKAKLRTKPADSYPILNCDICTDIGNAYMTQGINFINVPQGGCTLEEGDTEWPFTVPAPINIPSPANPEVNIRQGLNTSPPNNVYEYVVSCCQPAEGVHTVTVIG
jgi:hypothetical protein